MISIKLLVYLSIGTAAMLIPIMIQVLWNDIKLWKAIPIAIALTISGTLGTYLLFFIENHWIGGTSFYGAVFLVPIVFVAFLRVFHIPYGILLDMCAPAECMMLSIMKVQCLLSGCCGGRALYVNAVGETVHFPSQMIELMNALLLCAVLLVIAHGGKNKGGIYPLYMVLYGTTRLILNIFRENQSAFLFGLPPGHIWSIVSMLAGSTWLIMRVRKKASIR